MATVYIADHRLRVRLTRAQKDLGLLRDTDVALSQVRDSVRRGQPALRIAR